MAEELFHQLAGLQTEQRNAASSGVDCMTTEQILRLLNAQDRLVAVAVEHEIPYITSAVDIIVEAFKNGGRLIYVGAGTSGRLGVVDASECPPTFGTDPSMVMGLIAGGPQAMFRSQEGAEDDTARAEADLDAISLAAVDVVCGIAASRRTPYVVAAVAHARMLGCRTLYVTTNPRAQFDLAVDVAICPDVGPEVIMGSTRMKSGTAQKLVLNMLTTTAMIKLGKVYQNMMVDLQQTNAKLVERSKRIIMIAAGVSYPEAENALIAARGHVKSAIVMCALRVPLAEAHRLLEQGDGFVRKALAGADPPHD